MLKSYLLNSYLQRKSRPPSARRIFAHTITFLSLVAACTTASAIDPLRTSGNQILAGGEAKPMGGHSLFWHNVPAASEFYNAPTVERLKNDWNSKIIRAAIGIEVPFNADRTWQGDRSGSLAAIDRVVNAAVANDMYVIIDFHSHHAHNLLADAQDFFGETSSRYGHLDNVIYEIYNEPEWCDGAESHRWASTIKPYAESVIPTIRANDPDNLILVGTRCFSQRVDEAAANPINDNNVAYVLHFYAASHKAGVRGFAQTALDRGAPIFVTEWGTTTFNGDGFVDETETRTWINWLNDRNIPHVNWSASSQPESSAIWNGDGSYKFSGNLVGELVQATNGDSSSEVIDGPCRLGFAPGLIQAEDFCHAKGVQFEDTSDVGGGQNMGWVDAGDWITFDIDLPQSGDVRFDFRVASNDADGGSFVIEEAGGGVQFGTVSVPNTGDWQSWTNVSEVISLSQGTHTIALAATNDGWNLNWLEISLEGGPCEGPDCPCEGAECPCEGPNCSDPVVFQAEAFSAMQGIQLEATGDVGGGQNVGWVNTGDWMRYTGTLPVSTNNRYDISYRVARQAAGDGRLSIGNTSGAVFGEIAIPSTSGWQNWTTITQTVTIPAGTNVLQISALSDSWNLNWFEVKPAINNPNPESITVEAENFDAMSGVIVGGDSVGWIDAGDWMTYHGLQIPSSTNNSYRVTYRVARGISGSAQFKIEQPGGAVNYGQITVPSTGDWNGFTTASHVISLPAGTSSLAIAAIDGGWNIDSFTIEAL